MSATDKKAANCTHQMHPIVLMAVKNYKETSMQSKAYNNLYCQSPFQALYANTSVKPPTTKDHRD